MKFVLATLAANAASITCVVFAGILAMNGREGWGWFLLIAVFCIKEVRIND